MQIPTLIMWLCWAILFTTIDGAKRDAGQLLISNGRRTTAAQVPWHAGIYGLRNGSYVQLCGGTLISAKVVVSAAHCFWDNQSSRKANTTTGAYVVALGKYHRDWEVEDEGTQGMGIAGIFLHKRFRGRRRNYDNDIAVIQLVNSAQLTTTVQFALMDWNNTFDSIQLVTGREGIVAGWGLTEEGVPSNILKSVDLPYVRNLPCFDMLGEEVQIFMTYDKFCAGYADRNTSVCPGDSGGGWVFRRLVLENGFYKSYNYLRGVVSVGFTPASHVRATCYAQQVTGFSSLTDSATLRWIKAFTIDIVLGADCQMISGAAGVSSLIAQCPAALDMISEGLEPEIISYNGDNPVVCCALHEQTTTPRNSARRGTPKPIPILEMSGKSWEKCVQYSSAVRQEAHAPLLVGGDDRVLEADCAQSVQPLIMNGEKVQPKEYPHMVALGFGEANNIAWSCGGSLISDRFVLTAASCRTMNRGNVRWARLGDLNLFETTDEARPVTLEVIERIPHPEYKPRAHYFDIALLRLNASVEFNAYVRPACLHTNRTTPEEDVATATGWGVTDRTAEEFNKDLMKVELRFADPQRCNIIYKKLIEGSQRLARSFQDDSMICAGDTTNQGRDTCTGDSGGPLQVPLTVPYCMYSIVGVTSFGVTVCGALNSPSVYTRVSHFVPWIKSIVWPN